MPRRTLLIAAGSLTQVLGIICLVLSLASLPVAADLKTGTTGVIASVIASLAAIVCGSLVWRGRLIPLALAMGLNVGFGIGLPRAGSAIGATLRFANGDTLIAVFAIAMFIAAVLCIVAVPSALKLRAWARGELARPDYVEPQKPSVRTLPGLGPAKLAPTQVLHVGQRGKPTVIIGVAVTLITIGIIVMTATLGGSSVEEPDVVVLEKRVDAGVVVAAIEIDASMPQTIEQFVENFHEALRTDADLPVHAQAFAFGVEANDLAEGRDAVIAQLRDDIGPAPREVAAQFSAVASDGNVGWIAEELVVGDNTFVVTAVLGFADNAWTIHALHWARAMPNSEAFKLARDGELAVPDVIPETHDESELAKAMRAAFASKPSFVEAFGTRPDAFNFGSAGEKLRTGEAIRKIFGRIKATIRLHDAVKIGPVGDRGGWGAANVDFTENDTTQTFRVLAAWVREDAGWRIVQTQWSNPR